MLSSKNVSEETKLNPVIFLKESINAFHSSHKYKYFYVIRILIFYQ